MLPLSKSSKVLFFLAVLLITSLTSYASRASSEINLSRGQTVYVPIYSHIYCGDRERPFDLAATLSIRNTDPANSITVIAVKYYATDGRLIKHFLDKPVQLKALASTRYVIKETDRAGGSGANFIVKWTSENAVNDPIIESVMIGTGSQQGISFTSRGQVIKERID